jgi:hypothetical protein
VLKVITGVRRRVKMRDRGGQEASLGTEGDCENSIKEARSRTVAKKRSCVNARGEDEL